MFEHLRVGRVSRLRHFDHLSEELTDASRNWNHIPRDFREQWLSEVISGNPSTTELGHRFAGKLTTQWLDIDPSSDDLVYCDGSGDGGIDIAFLDRGDAGGEDMEDLDQLYERNVRRFLGGRGRVNKAIQETLRTNPERFGLFNNGITIVVNDFEIEDDGLTILLDSYIVNGCQTTRSIWDVCYQRLEAGGHGVSPELEEWKERAARGVVVTKIARVGSDGLGSRHSWSSFTTRVSKQDPRRIDPRVSERRDATISDRAGTSRLGSPRRDHPSDQPSSPRASRSRWRS